MADALSLAKSLCHGCLSADRDLSPIGEFSDMFTMICQRKVRVPGMADIHVCWECTATLKRIQTFNKQVNKAQNKLRLFIRRKETCLPKPLSKLKTTKTNDDFICLIEPDETEPDIKPLKEIKTEEDCDEENGFKQEDDADFSDANNAEEDIKQDPSFIVDLKDLEEKPRKQKDMRYTRISLPEEMFVKEQALVELLELDGCIDQDSRMLHGTVYRCLVCGHRSPSLEAAGPHVIEHGEMVKCSLCEYCCRRYRDFREHYKIAHVQFLCDYCGKKCKSKQRVEKHITENHFDDSFRCKVCQRKYSSKIRLAKHIAYAHDVCETEETFCVECNTQFKNRTRFTAHLAYTLTHQRKKERVKCQDAGCDKTYATRQAMMNHYKYVHLGKSQYYCSICEKYFLSRTRYANHRRYTHDGLQRPRDKICSVCGRGFDVNRTLRLHMRTHTGERPHECAVCDARFAQKTARNIHQKKHTKAEQHIDF